MANGKKGYWIKVWNYQYVANDYCEDETTTENRDDIKGNLKDIMSFYKDWMSSDDEKIAAGR